jgi:CubicO group peptidase (beta-lactamase class C family)
MKVLCLSLLLAVSGACVAPAKRVSPPDVDDRATVQLHVEQHLLATVQVEGEAVHFTLAERMAKYRVPGVSIAVFDDYELVWAAAYGVADVDTGEPARDTTLFQAGSISK